MTPWVRHGICFSFSLTSRWISARGPRVTWASGTTASVITAACYGWSSSLCLSAARREDVFHRNLRSVRSLGLKRHLNTSWGSSCSILEVVASSPQPPMSSGFSLFHAGRALTWWRADSGDVQLFFNNPRKDQFLVGPLFVCSGIHSHRSPAPPVPWRRDGRGEAGNCREKDVLLFIKSYFCRIHLQHGQLPDCNFATGSLDLLNGVKEWDETRSHKEGKKKRRREKVLIWWTIRRQQRTHACSLV